MCICLPTRSAPSGSVKLLNIFFVAIIIVALSSLSSSSTVTCVFWFNPAVLARRCDRGALVGVRGSCEHVRRSGDAAEEGAADRQGQKLAMVHAERNPRGEDPIQSHAHTRSHESAPRPDLRRADEGVHRYGAANEHGTNKPTSRRARC